MYRRAGRRRALRKFLRHRAATISLVVLVLLTLAALFAPLLAPFDPEKLDILNRLRGPSARH